MKKNRSFFDLTLKEKKKIIKQATRESNKEQLKVYKRTCNHSPWGV